jgi:hypothetical protein
VAGAGGKMLLRLGGTLVVAQTEAPPVLGEQLTLRVIETGPRPVLVVEARDGPAALASPAGAATGSPNLAAPPVPVEEPGAGLPLTTGVARALGERIVVLTGGAPTALPNAVPLLAAEILARMPEAVTLGTLLALLSPGDDDVRPEPLGEAPTVATRRLGQMLRRAGSDPARLAAEIERLAPGERGALRDAAAVQERRLLASAPELGWLRALHQAAMALAEARPEAAARTPPPGDLAPASYLLLSRQPAGAPDRLRLVGDGRKGRSGTAAPPATAVLELALPAIGPVVASLALQDDALTVRLDLAAARQVPAVAMALPVLTAALEGLGLRVDASAGQATGVATSAAAGVAAGGLSLWA